MGNPLMVKAMLIVSVVLFSMFGGGWLGMYMMGFNNQHIFSSLKVVAGLEDKAVPSAWLLQACRRSLPEV